MATYEQIYVNHIGKGLKVSTLKRVLDFLPDDAVLAPNETTRNLSIFTPDMVNAGQINFVASEGDVLDVLEVFDTAALSL